MKKKKICIVGGGISGLSIGYLLSKEGHKVTVLERSGSIGGLVQTHKTSSGQEIEKFYHHIFKNDHELIELISELGLDDRVVWDNAKTSIYYDKKFYGYSTILDLARLPLIIFVSTLRIGLVSLTIPFLKVEFLRKMTSEKFIKTFMGKTAWQKIWQPLFEGKFGEFSKDIGAPWFASRIKHRAKSRKRGQEILGCMEGGFGVLIERLAEKILENGGEILTDQVVKKVELGPSSVIPENPNSYIHKGNKDKFIISNTPYDLMISTVAPHVAANILPLSEAEKKKLLSIKYIGAICSVIELREKLTDYYWSNILDENIPFKGLIEHTNLVGTKNYGGKHIVYLSHYTKNDSDYFLMKEDDLEELYIKNLEKIFPEIRKNILSFEVYRAKNAQPIIPPSYIPPTHQTSIPSLYLTSMAHIYPEDRGMNQAVKEAIKIKDLILKNHKKINKSILI